MAVQSSAQVQSKESSPSTASQQTKTSGKGGFEGWGRKWGLLLSLAVGLAIWMIPMSGINITQHKVLSIFGGAVALWVTIGVNFAVSSLLITTFLYFWVGNASGAVKNGALLRNTDFALSGFTANWIFEPPVSTPISRMMAIAALRMS